MILGFQDIVKAFIIIRKIPTPDAPKTRKNVAGEKSTGDTTHKVAEVKAKGSCIGAPGFHPPIHQNEKKLKKWRCRFKAGSVKRKKERWSSHISVCKGQGHVTNDYRCSKCNAYCLRLVAQSMQR